jgi:hypothetical protein
VEEGVDVILAMLFFIRCMNQTVNIEVRTKGMLPSLQGEILKFEFIKIYLNGKRL